MTVGCVFIVVSYLCNDLLSAIITMKACGCVYSILLNVAIVITEADCQYVISREAILYLKKFFKLCRLATFMTK